MKLSKNQSGFTIIELLVVIVVIAILVALTLPNLFGLQKRARDDARKNDLKNLQQALETYYNDNNAYPGALADLNDSNLKLNDPQNVAYEYDKEPDTCTTAAKDCQSYTLRADLENDNDPSAVNGKHEVKSVNQPGA
jgi:type II secretion system protein G